MSRDEPAVSDAQLARFVERTMGLLIGRAADERDVAECVSRELQILPLAGDGSTRRIYRAVTGGTRAVAVANPLPPGRDHPDENEGFLAVREYLHQRKVRVPAFYAANLDQGLLLLEDLGDTRLADLRGSAETMPPEALPFYEQAIDSLVQMQIPGDPRFRLETTPNPAYTCDFIWEQEARYFLTELAEGAGGRTWAPAAIETECRRLASAALGGTEIAGGGPAAGRAVFMHRDYQSRNLMVVGKTLAVIDFQGARLGPAAYDLAALLFDPYACLDDPTRERLKLRYRERAAAGQIPGIGHPQWERIFLANAANRLMQALGAFAKLGIRKRRKGFREHIPAGLALLGQVLEAWGEALGLQSLVRGLWHDDWISG